MNIILIGMPGSGKTTIGRRLAQALYMDFLDLDCLIEEETGLSITDIFRKSGESYFRDLEEEACRKASLLENTVISTGGGAVLRQGGITLLKGTGKVVFLDTPVDTILKRTDFSGRPLLKDDAGRIRRLYAERISLYRSYADIVLDNSGSPDETLKNAVNILDRV
jgi:shikimate kinase